MGNAHRASMRQGEQYGQCGIDKHTTMCKANIDVRNFVLYNASEIMYIDEW